MRILIVEDEHFAAVRLEKLVQQKIPNSSHLGTIDTVEEAVEWISSHPEPDLIFMDIQLADGLSFQIFEKATVNCPVIFTTAYDDYALEAFKVNSIDYLLKPIDENQFERAIEKYHRFFPTFSRPEVDWKKVMHSMLNESEQYKQRFLVKTGNAFSYLSTNEISLIYSEDGLSFALDAKAKRFHLDNSLEKIEHCLDPNHFFRISRKHIVALGSIQKVHPYLNQRLKVEMNVNADHDLIVSREKATEFKKWLDK